MRILEGKTAIITGCGSGIGYETLKKFAENGSDVLALAHRETDELRGCIAELSEQYGVTIELNCFDLKDVEEIKIFIKKIKQDKKTIDILVNNAGASYDALLPMLSIDKSKDLFDINFFAQFQLTQYIARIMMGQKSGVIVNVGSYLGFEGNRGQMIYSATKAAVHGMTRSLSKELALYGIRVNAVAPGVVDTKLLSTMKEEEYKEAVSKNAMGRAAKPEEIANMIMVLASDLSSYVNGQIIRVDGGM